MKSDNDSDDILSDVAYEIARCVRRGETPPVEAFVASHPQLEFEIRELYSAVLVLEEAAERESEHTLLVGQLPHDRKVGEFRIVKEIGRGGMGVVYKAKQEPLGRHVALKILPLGTQADSSRLERFQREAQATAKLHHTNIVPVFAFGQDNQFHYLAMQFIDGTSLDTMFGPWFPPDGGRSMGQSVVATSPETGTLSETSETVAQPLRSADDNPAIGAAADRRLLSDRLSQRPCPADLDTTEIHRIAHITEQVALALEHAHSQGVLHRDVKPSNILVDSAGNAWITDFGLARVIGCDDLTHSGDILGTIRYMSPERFQGVADERGDIYGLGLTLYELLTRQRAYRDADRATLIHKITETSLASPREIAPAIPRDLETIVLKAIARDPSSRYQSAGDLAADLRRFLEDRPILARRQRLPMRLWRWFRRNPYLGWLTAACILLMLSTIVTLAISNVRIKNERDAKVDALARAASNERTAQRNYGIAHENYGIAKEAVEEFLEGIIDDPQLNSRGELQGLRRQLLTQLIPFYDALAKRKTNDASMESERGLAYMKLAMLKSEMGESQSAIENSRIAAAIFERQAAAFPDDAMYRLVLMDCHKNLGKTLAEHGRLQEALDETDKAIQLVEGLTPVFRDPADGLQELSRLRYNRSHMLASLGRWQESLVACEESIATQKMAIPLTENAPEARFILSNGYNHLGGLLSEMQHDQDAQAAFESAAEILRTLKTELPDNRDYRFVLATTCNNLGVLHSNDNSDEQAQRAFEEALETLEPLSDAYPSVVAYQQSRIATLVNLGEVHRRERSLDLAMQSAQAAAQIADDLLDHVTTPEFRLHASTAYALHAKVLTDLDQVDRAQANRDRALQILQQLSEENPDNVHISGQLRTVQQELAVPGAK